MQNFNKREYISIENVYKQDFVYDQQEELSDFNEMPEFEKFGYVFKGWSTNQTSSTIEFKNKAEISNLTSVDNATINLYAIWEKDNYVIQYNPFISGNTFISNVIGNTYYQSANYDTNFKLTPNLLVTNENAYEFVGWFDYKKLYSVYNNIEYESKEITYENFEHLLATKIIEVNNAEIDDNRLAPYEFNKNVTNLFALFIKVDTFTHELIDNADDTNSTNEKYYIITGLTDYGKTLSKIEIKSNDSNIVYTAISSEAFKNYSNLKSVIIPEDSSISVIGESAFEECENLENITINTNIIDISKNLFKKCTNLKSVIIPEDSSISVIGESAFEECENLENINITNNVSIIGKNAFKDCKKIKEITIANAVTLIDEYAFYNCINLKDVIFTENSTINTISNFAFKDCSVLRKIDIPNSIENIGSDGVFENCYMLQYININKNYIFTNDTSDELSANESSTDELLTIDEEINNDIIEDDSSLDSDESNNSESIVEDSNSESENELNNRVFLNVINDKYYCKVLANNAEIEIFKRDSNNNILIGLTDYGKELSSIYIPDDITIISTNSFKDNNNIKEIIISEKSKLRRIESSAFNNCEKLDSMFFPKSIENVASDAFNNCANLDTIYYDIPENSNINDIFNNNLFNLIDINNNIVDLVNYNIDNIEAELYSITYVGKTQSSITIPDTFDYKFVNNINKYAFYNSKNLENITLPNTIKNIKIGAFKECTSLKTINLPNDAIDILQLAFYNTKSLSNIKINTNSQLTKISEYAFGNSGLESIVLPSTFIILNSYVFDNCKKLNSVRFLAPELDYIHDFAFNDCTRLEYIYMYNIKDMSNYYKWGCSNVDNV